MRKIHLPLIVLITTIFLGMPLMSLADFVPESKDGATGFIPLYKGDCDKAGLNCGESDDTSSLAETIFKIINAGLILVAAAALVAIIIGGIYYIISMGDTNKTETAKKAILYAVIGLIVVGLSLAIVKFTQGILEGK